MFGKNLFTVSEFAKISGVSRQTLIYYDKIGLFSPIEVAENGYRMYSHTQIGIISIICILSDLGVRLEEIKKIVKNVSPETTERILRAQAEAVRKKIERLTLLEEMIDVRLDQTDVGNEAIVKRLGFDIKEFTEEVPLFIGDKAEYSKREIPDEVMVAFFDKCEASEMPLVFALGYIKSREDVLRGREDIVSAMCFRLKSDKFANGSMPKGMYAVGYALGDYGETDYIYSELDKFLKANGLALVGDVYEEYLHDEFTQNDPKNYVMQISAPVKRA